MFLRRMVYQRGWVGVVSLLGIVLMLVGTGLGLYLFQLDHWVRTQFEGHRWILPAKVYARPMELYAGAGLTEADVLAELHRLHYVEGAIRNPGYFSHEGTDLLVHLRRFVYADAQEAEQVVRLRFDGGKISALTSTQTDQNLVRLDPLIIGSIYPAQQEDRILMRLAEAPPGLLQALLATEDRDFYHHHGVSLRGIARAMLIDLWHGHLRQGGSTLTQQLVKNFYLSDERTLRRKLREIAMALLIELHYSKNEILEAYLNEVTLGQAGKHAIHGFGLASQYYFGQPVTDLSLEQAATLVGMVKGPTLYDPRTHRLQALNRRNIVLANMLHEHFIQSAQYQRLIRRPLVVIRHPDASGTLFPAFMDVVRQQLKQDYKDEQLQTQGLRIFTTLDPRVQRAAEAALQGTLAHLRHSARSRAGLQGPVLVSNPQNGELLAVVGSADPVFMGYNRALVSARQVGSLLKPGIYLTALASHHASLISRLDNSPLKLEEQGHRWQPHNAEPDAPLQVTLEEALKHSYNLASIRLGLAEGLPQVIATLHRLGIEQTIPQYPSTLLGAISLTPWQILGFYQTIASSGFRIPVRAIREVVDRSGQPLSRYEVENEQVVSASALYLLWQALHAVTVSGTASAAGHQLPGLTDMAGKTGTTNELRDSWFAGFTGNRLAVVWVGRDDNHPMGLAGAQGALPVWISLMRQIHPQPTALPQPEDIVWAWVDPLQQALSQETCAGAVYRPFFSDTLPKTTGNCTAKPTTAVAPASQVESLVDHIKSLWGK